MYLMKSEPALQASEFVQSIEEENSKVELSWHLNKDSFQGGMMLLD